ncbi:MAG: DUF805 domain-containing protein [Clostridiales bacterium]|nr:DUF805 domain-containing protein [Clostridiales bacterium]
MRYYFRAFKKYADFSGRASRKEFWLFQLFNFLIATAFSIALMVLLYTPLVQATIDFGLAVEAAAENAEAVVSAQSAYLDEIVRMFTNLPVLIVALVSMLYSLVIFIPSLAITVRRLHDSGKSGACYILTFTPYIASIIIMILGIGLPTDIAAAATVGVNFISLIGPILLFVFLVLKGTDGENKYGSIPDESSK